jgi:GTP-binding protein HflX
MVPSIAIAGYTNAGKSSLMNLLTGAGVLVEDALFATLDPTVRKARLADGRPVLLTDTVGFVRHLPHQLVEAFRSTLEEVANADLVVHVVDGSHPDPESQLTAVRSVLADVDAADIPELVVVNKIDAADPLVLARLARHEPNVVFVSAKTREGLETLASALVEQVPHLETEMLSEEFVADGTLLTARVGPRLAAQLEPYAVAAV